MFKTQNSCYVFPRYIEFKKKRYEYDHMNDCMNVVLTLAAILYFGITVWLILFLCHN